MNNTASRFSRFHASALMHLRTLTLVHFFLLALVSTADTQGPYTYEIIDDQATTTDFDTAYSGPLRKTPFWTMSREELLDSLMKRKRLNFDRLDGGGVTRYVKPVCVRQAIWPG